MTSLVDELRDRCEAAGQGHLLRFWDELGKESQARLVWQIQSLDFELLRELRGLLDAAPAQAEAPRLEPPEVFPLERDSESEREAREATARGEELFAAGKVGFLTVAGGQGSRLGFEGPKGAFGVGPVSDVTLFEWHAARIHAARERYGVSAPWYLMTSASNDAATRAFFELQDHFGLDPADIDFFQQAMLPALDESGLVVMSATDSLFLAPNGHGGTLSAFASSGCLADARGRGVEQISYFQVDNPLIRPADPLFVGLHAGAEASMSSKAVAKADPGERVGVLGLADGRMGCIEYSDLPPALRDARDDEGRLLFRAGNAACHMIEARFVEQLTSGKLELPWHVARKELAALGDDGTIGPRPGVKFETFIFDALSFSERSVTLEIDRVLEFSPVKNATGGDSPESCRRDLTRMFAGWAGAAGVELPEPADDGSVPIEVDPRFAEDEREFAARMPAEPRASKRGHLYR